MSAGAATCHAEMIGIDAIFFRVETTEPNGAVHVLDDFGDLKFWLRAMHDGENGVAAIEKRLVNGGADGVVGRKPAAAHDENDSKSIRLRGLENIHRQGGAEFSSVDDLFRSLELNVRLGG